jgi:hypothetical protein
MTSSGLLLSTVIFIIALNLTPGIARGKHRGVVVLHSVNHFTLERYPPESICFEVPWETERKIIKKIKSKRKDVHAFDWEDCEA